jgi:hypothetical protein
MTDAQVRLSNGAKAAQIAAEHFAAVEGERDDLRERVGELEGRLAEQNDFIDRLQRDKDMWMQKALSCAHRVIDASALLVAAAREAQEIIGPTKGEN